MQRLIITFLPLVSILILSTNCRENDVMGCIIKDPIENISWLKEIQVEFAGKKDYATRIVQYTYRGNCVFLINDCLQCPDGLAIIYNTEKEIVCVFGGIAGHNTCPDFNQEATNPVVLWNNVKDGY